MKTLNSVAKNQPTLVKAWAGLKTGFFVQKTSMNKNKIHTCFSTNTIFVSKHKLTVPVKRGERVV